MSSPQAATPEQRFDPCSSSTDGNQEKVYSGMNNYLNISSSICIWENLARLQIMCNLSIS